MKKWALIPLLVIVAFFGFAVGQSMQPEPKPKQEVTKPKSDEPPWLVNIPTKDHLGQKVEIVVFPWPLQKGGFVVNVHSPKNKNGHCWGTVIYKDVGPNE